VAKRKRGCLGCSFPILIGIAVIFLAITIICLLAGPIGQGFLNRFGVSLDFPSWLVVPQPAPHLPAPVLFHIFGLPITNTILAAWFTVIVVVAFCFAVSRRMKIVPGRVQAAFEFALGWLYDLCQGIAGEQNGRRFFPVVATIFLFVIFNAWLSLIPGFGSIMITSHGHEHELLRGANTDVNTTLAIALVSFVFVIYYGLKMGGRGFVRQYINFRPFFRSIGQLFKGKFNLMDIFSGAIAIFVGGLEFLSLLIRNVSFTFRLFGNMTAGEILILIAAFLVPWVAALPVYGLELLVGFVQALIFAGLTLVFVTMAVTPHEAESH
jgi:F-type H+-transporting ATPase subunit a